MATTPQLNAAPQEDIAGDSLTRFVRGMQNQLSGGGTQAFNAGQTGLVRGAQDYKSGLNAMAPVLETLTRLVKGDQADVSQAIQPEANRIRDSFAAVRNMISAQPRGGGKTSTLAEAPFQQAKAIGDIAAAKRSEATGELGNLSTTLAGLGQGQEQIGLGEAGLGASLLTDASKAALERRNQDMGEGSFAANFQKVAQGIEALV